MIYIQEHREKALYGVTIEPLELALLTGQERLTLERSILGYQVPFPSNYISFQVSMSLRELQLEGLSGLSLKNLSLSRDRNLTSIFTEAVLDAPYLLLTGLYNMEGTAKESILSYLLPDISSEGEQAFSINITRARIRADLRVNWAPFHLHLPSVGAQHDLKVCESSTNIIPPPSSVHQPMFGSFLTFSGPQLSTRPPPASWPCLICTWEDSKLDIIILQTCQRWWSAAF